MGERVRDFKLSEETKKREKKKRGMGSGERGTRVPQISQGRILGEPNLN